MKNNEENKVLPRGFMIPNVENKEDYAYYKTRIFRTVPQNTVLVCRNKFSGRVYALGSGLRITAPWVESKLTCLAIKMMDLPQESYKTKDGIVLKIKISMTIKIDDAVKYEVNSQTPLTELSGLTHELTRIFVAENELDDIYESNTNKNILDKQRRYDEFQENYGIKVETVYFKNIELPKTIADDYEKQKVAEKNLEIAKIEAETKRINANAKAMASKIEGEANASIKAQEIEYIVGTLAERGLNKDQIVDYLAKAMFAKQGTHVIANLNGTPVDSSNISAMAAVANLMKNNDNDNIKDKNENNEKKDVKKRIKK